MTAKGISRTQEIEMAAEWWWWWGGKGAHGHLSAALPPFTHPASSGTNPSFISPTSGSGKTRRQHQVQPTPGAFSKDLPVPDFFLHSDNWLNNYSFIFIFRSPFLQNRIHFYRGLIKLMSRNLSLPNRICIYYILNFKIKLLKVGVNYGYLWPVLTKGRW